MTKLKRDQKETFDYHGLKTDAGALTLLYQDNVGGSDAIKEQYLPGIVSGETKFCFAITEADAGTNSFNIKTRAVADGDKFVINGSKIVTAQVVFKRISVLL